MAQELDRGEDLIGRVLSAARVLLALPPHGTGRGPGRGLRSSHPP